MCVWYNEKAYDFLALFDLSSFFLNFSCKFFARCYIVLHCIVLYDMVSYRIKSYRIVWHGIVSYRIASHCTVLYFVLYCILSYRIFRIVSYHIISYTISYHIIYHIISYIIYLDNNIHVKCLGGLSLHLARSPNKFWAVSHFSRWKFHSLSWGKVFVRN